MAIQTSFLTYTGRLGKTIGFRRGKKNYTRTVPEKVKQTSATQRAAQRFGRASKTAARIRKAILPHLNTARDSTHVNRLTTLLIPSAGTDLQKVKGFRFNKEKNIYRFFSQALTYSNQELHIPKANTQLAIRIIATRSGITQVMDTCDGTSLRIDIPGNGTLIIVVQVTCCKTNYIAAEVVAVQEYQVTHTPTYILIPFTLPENIHLAHPFIQRE